MNTPQHRYDPSTLTLHKLNERPVSMMPPADRFHWRDVDVLRRLEFHAIDACFAAGLPSVQVLFATGETQPWRLVYGAFLGLVRLAEHLCPGSGCTSEQRCEAHRELDQCADRIARSRARPD